jgi:energy-coupling factor transporter ATP-binding protein EcfA2
LEETFDVVKFKMNSHKQNIDTLSQKITQDEAELLTVQQKMKDLGDAKSILTILKNYKMESKKDFILKTINTALEDVFDQNLRVDIEAMSATSTGKINMKYDIVLYQNDIEMARNEKLLGNNGGGVLSFISILFKVLVGYIYSDNKFFLFDESIAQVSPLYRPRLAQFLRKFCEEYKFTLVLISQTDDIDEYAHVGYYLDGEFDENNVPLLKIDHVMGEYPTDKYVYTKIENFQSIVKLEFRYKGFTVIRGNNNIGKSASFRAVNAILFNTFDVKDHPRKLRPRGAESKILFGFYDSEAEEDNRSISLKYKSNKVVYEFDGNTFSGKSLAFDKVKEKVESIGFKYVDLKETYKNFKGNLKDQTERLAMTSQHDGFYLVGNKASETEKVFNFLFDSTEVANAISSVTIDININHNIFNALNDAVVLNKGNLEKEKINYDIYVYKYYVSMITTHITNAYALEHKAHIKVTVEDLIANIDTYMMITLGIDSLVENRNILIQLQNTNVKNRETIVDELIEYSTYLDKLYTYFNDHEKHKIANDKMLVVEAGILKYSKLEVIANDIYSLEYYINSISKYNDDLVRLDSLKHNNASLRFSVLNELIDSEPHYQSLTNAITQYQRNLDKVETLKDKDYSILNSMSNLDKEFGIAICGTCGGSGHIFGEGH